VEPLTDERAGSPVATAEPCGPPPADVHDDPTAFVLGGSGGLRRRSAGALGTWLGLAIVGVLVAIPLRGLYRFTGGTMEEGFMLYFPERLAHGDVPNVDFLHLYGPGSLQVLAGWFGIFGHNLAAERTFGLLQHVGILLALFTLARAWGRAAATAVAALAVFYVLTPIALTAMAWNGGLALLLWSAVFTVRGVQITSDRGRRRSWAVAGLLAGLALTYRPDLIVAVVLLLGWLLWRHRASRAPVLLAALVGLLPMWVHLVMAGVPDAVRGMVIDPVFHLRAGRELPRPPSWGHLDGGLQAVAEEIPPWWKFPHLTASHTLFIWFFLMLAGAVGLLALAIWLRRHEHPPSGRSTALLAVGLVSLGILPQGLQRPDSAHLLWVTCVPFPFLVPATIELVRRWRPRITSRRAMAAGGAVALAVTFCFTSLFTFRYYLLHTRVGLGQVPHAFAVQRGDRYFYLGDFRAYEGVQAAVDELGKLANPGDRLLVGPSDLRRTWYSDVFIYWLFPELDPATYYIEMDPGLANKPGSSLAGDVASADFVILTGLWDGWMEPNSSMDFGSDAPNQVLRDHFCVVGDYTDGQAVLYRRCR
jgi:Dolichyl-phosphate-mannose-protein mannosyltransferase